MENNPAFNLYIDSGMLYEIYMGLSSLETNETTGERDKTALDLSDITNITGSIKSSYSANATTLSTFNVIVANATAGEILISLPASATSELALGPDPTYLWGYYDIVATNSLGNKIKIVGGKVYLNQVLNK